MMETSFPSLKNLGEILYTSHHNNQLKLISESVAGESKPGSVQKLLLAQGLGDHVVLGMKMDAQYTEHMLCPLSLICSDQSIQGNVCKLGGNELGGGGKLCWNLTLHFVYPENEVPLLHHHFVDEAQREGIMRWRG